jgi:hypothetical protein
VSTPPDPPAGPPEPTARVDGAVAPDAAAAGTEPAADEAAVPQRPHAFLVYNLARLGIFVVSLGVLYLFGFRGVALVLLALLVSGAISVVALFKLRNAATASLGSSWRRLSDRIDRGAASEDVD